VASSERFHHSERLRASRNFTAGSDRRVRHRAPREPDRHDIIGELVIGSVNFRR
jgi:hypothetical protein